MCSLQTSWCVYFKDSWSTIYDIYVYITSKIRAEHTQKDGQSKYYRGVAKKGQRRTQWPQRSVVALKCFFPIKPQILCGNFVAAQNHAIEILWSSLTYAGFKIYSGIQGREVSSYYQSSQKTKGILVYYKIQERLNQVANANLHW